MQDQPTPLIQTTNGSDVSRKQRQEARRKRLTPRLMSMLGPFWSREETPDAILAIDLECWLDVLEEYSDEEIREAWADFQRTGPRTARGALYKPDPGAIYQRIENRRAPAREAAYRRMLNEEQAKAAKEEAERKASVPTLERARQIIAEVSAKLTDKPQGEEK